MATHNLTDLGNAVNNGLWFQDILSGTNNSGQNGSLTKVARRDTIKLAAGASYKSPTGGFILPYLSPGADDDSDYIFVDSSALASISGRTNPLTDSSYYAKIINKGADPAIQLTEAGSYSGGNGTNYWKFRGLEIVNDGTDICSILIRLYIDYASTRAINYSAHHFVIDRCFVHPIEVTVAGNLVMPYFTSLSKAIAFGNQYGQVINSCVFGAGPFESYITGTDLVIDGSDNTKVTSASHTFVSGDVGSQITIISGTNFTKSRRTINSVTGGAAILSGSAGTVGATGGTWGMGAVGSGMCILEGGGLGDLLVDNNYLQTNYNPLFFGGADNWTPNTGTISASSINLGTMTGTATLSNVTNLAVGRYVAFQTTSNPAQGYTRWQSGKVTSIVGNDITFDLKEGTYNEWVDAPYVTGTARWVGDNIQNITVTNNDIVVMPSNQGTQAVYDDWSFYPKGICEFKDGINILWEGNTHYSSMLTPLAFYPNNQNATQPWVKVYNVTVRNNIFINAFITVPLDPLYAAAETDETNSGNITIYNNIFITKFDPSGAIGYDVAAVPARGSNVQWLQNTYVNATSIMNNENTNSKHLVNSVFKDNIVTHQGAYGFNSAAGPSAGSSYTTWTIINNLIVNTNSVGQQFLDETNITTPTSINDVGFVDVANDNYQLSSGSSYLTMSSVGGKPGVNWATLYSKINSYDWPFNWVPSQIFSVNMGIDF